MLERLLKLVQAGGTHRIDDLARDLDTSPQLVAVMLENLRRMGYLKEMGDSCEGKCSGCSLGCSSTNQGQHKIWTLTDLERMIPS